MKFLADCMLGKLAKWLRVLGFDVLYFPKLDDAEVLDAARKGKRVLLTRDTNLLARARSLPGRLFIESERWEDQAVQVLAAFDLWKEVAPHTRCITCNQPLKGLDRTRARNLVPPHVLERARSFALCPGCGRVFWEGTHFGGMKKKVSEILGRKPE